MSLICASLYFGAKDFIKKVLFAHLEKKPINPETTNEELRKIRLEIRRIGVNIDQALKLAHVFKNKEGANIVGDLKQILHHARQVDDLFHNLLNFTGGAK